MRSRRNVCRTGSKIVAVPGERYPASHRACRAVEDVPVAGLRRCQAMAPGIPFPGMTVLHRDGTMWFEAEDREFRGGCGWMTEWRVSERRRVVDFVPSCGSIYLYTAVTGTLP